MLKEAQDNKIMLSICVPTYGHEKYIRQALDSILMQKTQYSYEVLVGEDCSPDGTKEILKEYEKKYPDVFRMFYWETNLSQKGLSNNVELRKRSKGKYLITLEGDDYWTSEDKIEKQISFLENHPDYLAVAHNCVMVDKDSNRLDIEYPECKDENYSIKHLLYDIMPGQTATVMRKNKLENVFDMSILYKRLTPGDRLIYFALAAHGKIYCIQETMSAYRYVTSGGTSFSATHKYNFYESEYWHKELLDYAYKIKKYKAICCAEALYYAAIIQGINFGAISKDEAKKYTSNIHNKARSIFLYYKRENVLRNTTFLKRIMRRITHG